MHLRVYRYLRYARSRRGCGRYAVVHHVRPVPSELGKERAVAVWRVAWRLGVLHAGRGKAVVV